MERRGGGYSAFPGCMNTIPKTSCLFRYSHHQLQISFFVRTDDTPFFSSLSLSESPFLSFLFFLFSLSLFSLSFLFSLIFIFIFSFFLSFSLLLGWSYGMKFTPYAITLSSLISYFFFFFLSFFIFFLFFPLFFSFSFLFFQIFSLFSFSLSLSFFL